MCEVIRFPELTNRALQQRIDQSMLCRLPPDSTFLASDALQIQAAKAAIQLLRQSDPDFVVDLDNESSTEAIVQLASFLLRRSAERIWLPVIDHETITHALRP